MSRRHPVHTICLNCGTHFKSNFCPECGQKAEVERLTASHLLHETVHSITHYEKGFLHTLWLFLIKPGNAGMKYLSGKRKEFQKPVGYILILTGVYIILHNFIINQYDYHYLSSNSAITFEEQSNIFLRKHFTPFIFFILVISAFIIYIVLANKRYNFIEILTLCLYGGGVYFMILTVSDLILGVVFQINILSGGVFLWQTIASAVYNFWFCFDFFKKVRMRFFGLRMIITATIISLAGLAIMNYLPLVLVKIFG